jgi:hypothetical protein
MREFFGFKLSEVAMLAILLMASMPLIKETVNGSFLPLVFGLITAGTLQALRVYAHVRLTFGLQVLIVLLVALFFVPMPYRGKRLWEGFKDKDEVEDTESTPESVDDEKKDDDVADMKDIVDEKAISGLTKAVVQQVKDMKNKTKETKEKKEKNGTDESQTKEEFSVDDENGPQPHDLKDLGEQYAKANKKYRLPSEKADGEHHMDAGTTFMNAYKQLKPDQINALTNDTQKLISVQKDLMANLNNLKPLISDGKEIMKTFKGFFGSEPTSN